MKATRGHAPPAGARTRDAGRALCRGPLGARPDDELEQQANELSGPECFAQSFHRWCLAAVFLVLLGVGWVLGRFSAPGQRGGIISGVPAEAGTLPPPTETAETLPTGGLPMSGAERQELTARAQKAVAELEGAAMMLRSTYFEALIVKAVTGSLAAAQGDWLDRATAAAHCRCSTSEIDRAAAAGCFKTYRRAGTPLFKRSEVNALIEAGTWPKRGAMHNLCPAQT